MTAGEKGTHGALVRDVRDRDLGDSGKFKVFEPARIGKPSKANAETRQAPTRRMVEGERNVKGEGERRLAAKERRDPDLGTGLVETSGCGVSVHLAAR